MEFQPNFWFVNYLQEGADESEITLKVHYEDGVIIAVEKL